MFLLTSNNRVKNISILNESLIKLKKRERKKRLQRTEGYIKTGDMVCHGYVRHRFASSCGLIVGYSPFFFPIVTVFLCAHLAAKAPDVSIDFLNV